MVLLQVLSPDKIALALHTKQDMHIRARLNTRLNMGSVVTHRAVQSWSRHRHDCRDFGVTMAQHLRSRAQSLRHTLFTRLVRSESVEVQGVACAR
jgi:hypothetical protein